jgi:hypothetical protein
MVRSIRSPRPPCEFAKAVSLSCRFELHLLNSRDSLLPDYGAVMHQLGEDQPTTAGCRGGRAISREPQKRGPKRFYGFRRLSDYGLQPCKGGDMRACSAGSLGAFCFGCSIVGLNSESVYQADSAIYAKTLVLAGLWFV